MKKDSEDWDNGTNDAFYNYLGQTGALEEFAKQAGLNTCCDFETMQAIGWLPSEKKRSAHVLEVGGGLGRGLGWLLSNQFTRVSTIEKSAVFCDILQKKFNAHPDRLAINIINDNVKSLERHCSEKFTRIFWLWCGICDFSKKEHIDLLQLLMSFLQEENGLLIVDVPLEETNATSQSGNVHVIDKIEGMSVPTYHGYVPSDDEMYTYAKILKVKTMPQLFVTETKRKRQLWAFWHYTRKEIPITPNLRLDIFRNTYQQYLKNKERSEASAAASDDTSVKIFG